MPNGFISPEGTIGTPPPPASVLDISDSGQTPPDALDRILVSAARQGDMQAFGELIERHRSECLRRAILIMRNHGDAEEEVQNAFWKAFQRLDQYRGEGSFVAWLGRIVENQCLMRLREQRDLRFVCLEQAAETHRALEPVAQLANPEDDFGLQEVVALLRREVLRIPPLLRQAIILRDLDQLRMKDVAVRLGVSLPAAKSRLMRAREELRLRIRKHCGRKGPGTLTQTSRYSRTAFKRIS
jgi:RNA polymerase sigma-70 factor (ECF subfamily)